MAYKFHTNTNYHKMVKDFWTNAEPIDKVQQLHVLGLRLENAEQNLQVVWSGLTGFERKQIVKNILNKVQYGWNPTTW